MEYPSVTIICISYNHSLYIVDAINSIWNLDYPNIELIIADDASSDNSRQVIKDLIVDKEIKTVFNQVNIGHCKTFNKALKLATGEFVIDFSADDIFLKSSVRQGINQLTKKGESFEVVFSDAERIDEFNKVIGCHITSSFFYLGIVPQGDIYKNLLEKYFISPPTMIYRKSLIDKIGGYNESLSYEDFDFWVRSSRITNYCYLPEITVQKRIHMESVSSKQYTKNSTMLESTLSVCEAAFVLNIKKTEDFALIKRLIYEAKMALLSYNFSVATRMLILSIKVFFKIRS